jgi:hypothetical protein
MATTQIRLFDREGQRRLRVKIAGERARVQGVVLPQLGTPNAGVLFDPWIRDAIGRSLSLVSYDRSGGSSPQPGRTVADCVEDGRAAGLDYFDGMSDEARQDMPARGCWRPETGGATTCVGYREVDCIAKARPTNSATSQP